MRSSLPHIFAWSTFAAVALASALTFAQGGEEGTRQFTLLDGTRVVFSPQLDTGEPQKPLTTRVQLSGINAINRVLFDEERGVYFGYTVQVEPIVNTNKFRLIFTALVPEKARQLINWPSVRRLVTPLQSGRRRAAEAARKSEPSGNGAGEKSAETGAQRYPAPTVIEDGDSLSLDVLVNPKTGAKIADRLTVSSRDVKAEPAATPKARDFSLDDVELRLEDYRVFVNGRARTAERAHGGCAGPLVWIYIPGRGQFAFSIKPRPGYGFEKAGVIEENKIVFSVKGERIEWHSKLPILAGGGNFNLYVRHDPNFQPKLAWRIAPPGDRFAPSADDDCCLIGAAESIEALLGAPTDSRSVPNKRDESPR